MARITIEDCLKNIHNRYALVLLCSKRARQLFRGANPTVNSKNGPVVTSLREIAHGRVRFLPETPGGDNGSVETNLTQ